MFLTTLSQEFPNTVTFFANRARVDRSFAYGHLQGEFSHISRHADPEDVSALSWELKKLRAGFVI